METAREDAQEAVLRLVPINVREDVRVAVLKVALQAVLKIALQAVLKIAPEAVLVDAPAPVLMRVSDAPNLAQVAVSRPAPEAAQAGVPLGALADAPQLALEAVLEVVPLAAPPRASSSALLPASKATAQEAVRAGVPLAVSEAVRAGVLRAVRVDVHNIISSNMRWTNGNSLHSRKM